MSADIAFTSSRVKPPTSAELAVLEELRLDARRGRVVRSAKNVFVLGAQNSNSRTPGTG
jgi:hypothetical protein